MLVNVRVNLVIMEDQDDLKSVGFVLFFFSSNYGRELNSTAAGSQELNVLPPKGTNLVSLHNNSQIGEKHALYSSLRCSMTFIIFTRLLMNVHVTETRFH